MDIPRADRKELDKLCKEIFGVSSRWQKMVKGVSELVTKTVEEVVPGDKGAPDTTKEVQVPLLTVNGSKQYRTKFYTLEEVKNLLLGLKKTRDEYMEKAKQAQEQIALDKKIQQEAAGISNI